MSWKTFAFLLLVIFAVLSRFVPHPPNFAPIAALALFGKAFFEEKKWAYWVPLAALLISDLFLGLHSTMLFVYGSFALIAYLGRLDMNSSWSKIGISSVMASAIFFVVTNAGVWAMTDLYPKTLAGLSSCFVAAIPFFHNTLLGDALYTGVLFGAYRLVATRMAQEATA